MNTSLLAVLVLMVALTAIGGCIHFKISTPSVSNPSQLRHDQVARSSPTPTENKSGQEIKPPISIGSIAIYGLWWSDEQFESNFDADNPPSKKAYVKLDKWDASQPDSAHPDRIDIVCRLESYQSTDPYLP